MRAFVTSSVRLSCVSFLVAAGQIAAPALRAQGASLLRVEPMLTAGADAPSASAVADTKTILDRARAEAGREHKNILVKFGASWCSPCHLWDAVLADPKVSPVLSSRWVIVDLDVVENDGDTRHHATPGAQAYMASLGNKGINLPFLAVLRPSGAVMMTYVGFPTELKEFDELFGKLPKAEPSLSQSDLDAIRESLREHGKGLPHS